MRLSQLTLSNYRSYQDVTIELHPGPNVLLGNNGVGKTNIAEAVGYLSTLSSHRVTQDAPLVRHGQDQAFIRAQAHRGSQKAFLEVEINPGKSNRARINRASPVRASEILGILRTVVFAPEDLELIKGSPAVRRRFLDDLAVQLRPALGQVRGEYEKTLKQRNALLKSLRFEKFTATHESTLSVWDHQLSEAGARLLRARFDMLNLLGPHVKDAYQQISQSVRSAGVQYQSSLDADSAGSAPADPTSEEDASSADEVPDSAEPNSLLSWQVTASHEELASMMMDGLARHRRQERERALTLVGPHRDEVELKLDSTPVKGFASHGETWSFALALRLAAYRVMSEDDPGAGAPILILDDVFAELDARRRRRLAELAVEAEQLIVTAAVDDDVPETLLTNALRVESHHQLSTIVPFADAVEQPDDTAEEGYTG
ncbi:MAG TPA: DNA replication/repair protein RecF [Candidatus Nesterenkonia stercoripullorum]|uniref:DNA replication and repair protein RecF n=1 Tax=Candidatus Nesterenkonia stercoripullorum TaxID=2838701 RepID=A0A9D2A8L6_9MICC|nr:DNA replication/repair protein RecF [Candidatus Nesterenkonia stercoripullorum]